MMTSRGGQGGMHSQSRSASFASTSATATTTARQQPIRRPSVGSRLSFAVSTAERGEVQNENGQGITAEHQIEEEIAKIKRYEVSNSPKYSFRDGDRNIKETSLLTFAPGFYYNRYGYPLCLDTICSRKDVETAMELLT